MGPFWNVTILDGGSCQKKNGTDSMPSYEALFADTENQENNEIDNIVCTWGLHFSATRLRTDNYKFSK